MFTVNVSLASTAEYSSKAAESIKDLKPNAADILITSVITSMVTDLGVVAPTASGLLTYYDGDKNSTHSVDGYFCLLYTSPSPRDLLKSRMPSSA